MPELSTQPNDVLSRLIATVFPEVEVAVGVYLVLTAGAAGGFEVMIFETPLLMLTDCWT